MNNKEEGFINLLINQSPIILVIAPLLGALIVGIFGSINRKICSPVAIFSLFISLLSSILIFEKVIISNNDINYFIGNWEKPLGIGIQLKIDALNAFLILAISVVSILVAFFSIRNSEEKNIDKTSFFYILYLLLSSGLYGISISADAFSLFVLIEITSLSSYGLIAMGSSKRGTVAALNYVLMGTIGASFYLLGVGYLYLKTGALNMQAIHEIISNYSEVADSKSILIAFLFMLIGVWIKMAFFPLHGWLPNAYSYCPSSSSCVLAPLMTKVSVYVMIRIMISIFGLEWIFSNHQWDTIIVWMATITIIAGCILALSQTELKKILCYIIIIEVGYMVGGSWLANENNWGLVGTLYHILGDSIMTLCLFISVSILSKRFNIKKISDCDKMFSKNQVVSICFIIAALSIIGIPPTCGFFSKFYLIRAGIESGRWEYVIALLFSSLVNIIIFFRIFEIALFGSFNDKNESKKEFLKKPSWSEIFPLVSSACLIIIVGVMHGKIIEPIKVFIDSIK